MKQSEKITPEIKNIKLHEDIKSTYSSFNQSKERERVDAPLQKLESYYYKLLLSSKEKIKKEFNKYINK